MSDSAPNFTQSALKWRLSLFYGAVFLCIGTQMAFFPLWLQARGLDAGWIGLVMAVPLGARLGAVPLASRLAERRHALKAALVISAIATTLAFLVLGAVAGQWAILIAFFVLACVWLPVLPLSDAYALRGLHAPQTSYGPVRLWGSVAFILGTLAAGAAIPLLGAAHLIWLIALAAFLSALFALALPSVDRGRRADGAMHAALPLTTLLGLPVVIGVSAAAALTQGSHAAYYTFSAIGWRAAGIDSMTISVLWSVGVAAEILLFAISPRLPISPGAYMVIGAGAALLRWVLTSFEPSLGLLYAIQPLHGLSFGAMHLGTLGLFARLVPPRLIASAQGLHFALVGAVMALAQFASGRIYGSHGTRVYLLMAAMALGGIAIALWVRKASGEGWRRSAGDVEIHSAP